jgi:hypothetical protein
MSAMTMHTREIQALKDTLIFELTKALALPQRNWAKNVVFSVFGRAADAAAKVGLELDQVVARGGLSAGARWLLPRFVKKYDARGVEQIPATGPLVIAANHPGSIDSIVITAHVNRGNYKVIIGDIPFFEHLPHISERAFYAIENDTSERMLVVRNSIRHLKNGGALLIFPRGGIEADPEIMPRAGDEFQYWSRSLEIFLERVPGLQILIAIVSGVISPSSIKHPITWFRRARPDRQRLAFLYQLARQMLSGRELFGLTPRVTFGELISGGDHDHILTEVENAAHRTLNQHMTWAQP